MVAVADYLRTASGRESSLLPTVGVLFCIGLAGAFCSVFQYTTTPLAFVLVLVPVCYASWLLRDVVATYEYD
ncbi:hypothetical protein V5735_03595 (plasmid) [Haladaptatus sp. SPP-AMP-3]|uniref:hypothetical protein n=1 Tax=Haladaptatus sp. SPP-AMP-3 TaxID=3121295 RepID=UPI003C301CEE